MAVKGALSQVVMRLGKEALTSERQVLVVGDFGAATVIIRQGVEVAEAASFGLQPTETK
jgi:hypothetical protein